MKCLWLGSLQDKVYLLTLAYKALYKRVCIFSFISNYSIYILQALITRLFPVYGIYSKHFYIFVLHAQRCLPPHLYVPLWYMLPLQCMPACTISVSKWVTPSVLQFSFLKGAEPEITFHHHRALSIYLSYWILSNKQIINIY